MGVWDAVIVDEAHNARRGSNFYALLEQLRDYTHAYYLLTATPMQLHSGELYDLMQLLDLPGGWDNRDSFMEFFETETGCRRPSTRFWTTLVQSPTKRRLPGTRKPRSMDWNTKTGSRRTDHLPQKSSSTLQTNSRPMRTDRTVPLPKSVC